MIEYYCINLRSATERRQYCEAQFAGQGLSCRYFTGLDARLLGLCHPLLNVGHTGCLLSHYMLVQQIQSDDRVVIFEDDVILSDDFAENLQSSLASLPDDWEVAFAGWEYFEGLALPPLTYRTVSGPWVSMSSGCLWGTHAYIVNGKRGASALLRTWEPIRTTVDSQIYEEILAGRLTAYFLHPDQRLAKQGGFVSQIAGT